MAGEPEPAVEEEPEPTLYAVQVASFLDEAEALAHVGALGTRGYEARLVRRAASEGRTVFLVRLGYYEQLAEANAAAATFSRREGVLATAVPAEDLL